MIVNRKKIFLSVSARDENKDSLLRLYSSEDGRQTTEKVKTDKKRFLTLFFDCDAF